MPLVRSLFFDDPTLTDVDDEYFWGNDFLVAPVLEDGVASRQVLFPAGKWIDFFRWTAYNGGQAYMIDAPLDYLPVFVRAGAIIPMIPEIQNTAQYLSDRYLLKYFPDPAVILSSAKIYIDDGLTRQAATGNKFSIVMLEADYQDNHARVNLVREGLGFDGEPVQKEMVFEIERAMAMPTSVTFNAVTVSIAPDIQSYDLLTDAALYLPDQYQLLVKVQWNSQVNGILVIDGLEVTTSFSIPEPKESKVDLYPNPVTGGSQVSLDISVKGLYKFELYNGLGQIVGNHTENISAAGNFNYSWNELFPGNLPGGAYVLRIVAPGGIKLSKKIVILD
jgi:hypothetical protein